MATNNYDKSNTKGKITKTAATAIELVAISCSIFPRFLPVARFSRRYRWLQEFPQSSDLFSLARDYVEFNGTLTSNCSSARRLSTRSFTSRTNWGLLVMAKRLAKIMTCRYSRILRLGCHKLLLAIWWGKMENGLLPNVYKTGKYDKVTKSHMALQLKFNIFQTHNTRQTLWHLMRH